MKELIEKLREEIKEMESTTAHYVDRVKMLLEDAEKLELQLYKEYTKANVKTCKDLRD